MGFSLFDIAGPIMVGPSSSHTAGAARIGQFARALFDGTPHKVHFLLHGSFGEVYKGHATDKALLGGVLKMAPNDTRIKESFEIAEALHLDFQFEVGDLGPNYHPNSVCITMENEDHRMSVIGSSIGGGNIEIVSINNYPVLLTGNSSERFSTMVVELEHQGGILSYLHNWLTSRGMNIRDIQSSYRQENKSILVVLSLEEKLSLDNIVSLQAVEGVHFVRALEKLNQKPSV